MPTNVFLSRPTTIKNKFKKPYDAFLSHLLRSGYTDLRLGANQYTLDSPLTGVMKLMKTCRAAIILGYPQYEVTAAVSKGADVKQQMSIYFPTPWNQIEATLAYNQCLPVLVVTHEGISGGIFDHGVTGEYLHTTKLDRTNWHKEKGFQGIFQEFKKRIK